MKENKTMEPTDWLALFDGTGLAKWAFDGGENLEIDGDTLVVTDHPKGKGLKAEVGGASWDNYVLSADVMVKRETENGWYCVQLTGDGTQIYCQLMPGLVKLAYYSDETDHFTDIAQVKAGFAEGSWLTFEMKALHNVVTALIDGEEIVSGECPRGTDGGFPGFLINQQKESEVRIRNIRIRFLEPAEKQLQEYEKDASYNWLRHKEAERIAQQRA
ncbi:MAG: family 16 glycoside hydrolase [Planctomycetota bacterium]